MNPANASNEMQPAAVNPDSAGLPAIAALASTITGNLRLKQVKTVVTEIKKERKGKPEIKLWEVRVGSAVSKIYFTPSGGRKLFTLVYWVDGRRKREVYPSKEKAIAAAKESSTSLGKGDLVAADLTAKERVACARALDLLAPTGVPIEAAASEYVQAIQRLKEIPLLRAVDFYLQRHPANMVHKMVNEIVAEMLLFKQSDGLSVGYLQHLRYDLEKFAKAFHCKIGAVTGPDIDRWLRGLGVSPRTRNNLRNSVQTLFEFAKAHKYLPKDHDEIDAVARVKDGVTEIEIFTPKEMEEMLQHADARVIPFLALGAFAGIRHAEIQRLEWNDIQFDAGIIEIRAAKAKTASRRTVPILDNLRQWLERHRQEAGPVCVYLNMASEIESMIRTINVSRRAAWAKANKVSKSDLAAAEDRATKCRTEERKKRGARRAWGTAVPAGAETAMEEGWLPFGWKHNALRHSFISYRVAAIQNVAQVALEAGNSPQMIFKHYRELVRPVAAKEWFAIVPTVKN